MIGGKILLSLLSRQERSFGVDPTPERQHGLNSEHPMDWV